MLIPIATLGSASGVAAPGSGETIELVNSDNGVGNGLRFKELVIKLRTSHISGALGLKVYERSWPDDTWRVSKEVTHEAATADFPFTRYFVKVRASYWKVEYTNSANVLTSWEGQIIGDTVGGEA